MLSSETQGRVWQVAAVIGIVSTILCLLGSLAQGLFIYTYPCYAVAGTIAFLSYRKSDSFRTPISYSFYMIAPALILLLTLFFPHHDTDQFASIRSHIYTTFQIFFGIGCLVHFAVPALAKENWWRHLIASSVLAFSNLAIVFVCYMALSNDWI